MAVPEDSTAYPWRDTTAYILLQFEWEEAGSGVDGPANALGRELRSDFVDTSGYPDLSVYVNYAHGDETVEQIYGAEKLSHLAQIKSVWDPDNVFAYFNPLPATYP
ncbi:Uu.00g010160.m01.CDS01 [Anthostomella pinea]|uniref:Uu.00g010160.m01.CDS01 n=1 Tax=Anthostomella pinea TaxID=933095 RepID=A0AAI8VXJ5_9PEZI|nr:Uu.00g010160.m01.CDS01 [Anthostomella pinea]